MPRGGHRQPGREYRGSGGQPQGGNRVVPFGVSHAQPFQSVDDDLYFIPKKKAEKKLKKEAKKQALAVELLKAENVVDAENLADTPKEAK